MRKMWIALLLVTVALGATAEAMFAFEKVEYEVNAGKSIKLQPILQGAEKPKGAKFV